MDFLDFFALLILTILFVSAVGAWVAVGMLPGKIAHARKHPQEDAIRICGWMGALTMGLLAPIAFVWAYTKPNASKSPENEAIG